MESTFPDEQRGDLGRKLAALFRALESGIFERGEVLRLCLLASIAGESIFMLGPPGVAKSLIARRLQNAFADAECFDYLMGRFSTPDEIFGPVSINRLKNEDLYIRRTEHYLPEADIVFLDEIWKASPPIQNALLTALNEKIFRNGHDEMHLPLKLLIAASNETAPDESIQAFWDRFLVRVELQSLKSRANFLAMLNDQSDPYRDVVPAELKIDRQSWAFWKDAIGFIELGESALEVIAALRSDLQALEAQGLGPAVSDRRWKKCAALLRAVAFCNEKATVEAPDCLILIHCLWNQPGEQVLIRERVEAAVRDHAWVHLVKSKVLRTRLSGLQEDLRSASGYEEETTVRQARLADAEYYILESIPAGIDVPIRSGLEARIWRPDYETLSDSAPGLSTDIFLYQDGVYQNSAELPCYRCGEWQLGFGTATVKLLTSETRQLQRVHRPLGEAEWAVWDQGIAALMRDCQAEVVAATNQIAQLHTLLAAHFFVSTDYIPLLTHGLNVYIGDLAALQADAQGCQDHHGSC